MMWKYLKEVALEVRFYLGTFGLLLVVFLVLCVFLLGALIYEGYSLVWHGRSAKNDWFELGLD